MSKSGKAEYVARHRRAYFALLKGLDIDEADRHACNEALVGKASTKEWNPLDWDRAVAELQRRAGQHDDPHAHIRRPRPHGLASEAGPQASWPQCRAIEHLCDAVEWRIGGPARPWSARREVGPLAYACRHLLAGEEHADLREALKRAHTRDQKYIGGQWRVLPRAKASALIQALDTMRHHYPREASDA